MEIHNCRPAGEFWRRTTDLLVSGFARKTFNVGLRLTLGFLTAGTATTSRAQIIGFFFLFSS